MYKIMIRYFYLFILLLNLILLQSLSAQEENFKHELIFGGGLHTRGYQVSAEYLRLKNEYKALSIRMEFSEISSPKEKTLNAERLVIGGRNNRTFIYGKQNNLFALRFGAGQRFYISEKKSRSVVGIAFSYNAGFSLGMLKPYYLDLIYRLDPEGFRIISERYTEENKLKFMEPLDISGSSSPTLGWDELSIAPGLYVRGSLIFDWGPNDSFAKILEVGFVSDAYFRAMPIMVGEVRPPLFLNLFASFYFGKRW